MTARRYCSVICGLLPALLAVSLLATPLARATDPPDTQPPDRLEKKSQPSTEPPKPPEEPKQPQPPTEAKAMDPQEDPAKLRERITQDMQSAEENLKANDPGQETRQVQERILNNIDKLIELARNPPPMNNQQSQSNSQSQPQGGAQSQPQGGAQSQPQGGLSRRERREQQRRQMEQQARGGGQPQPMPGGTGPDQPVPGQGQAQAGQQPDGGRGQPGRDGLPDQLADVVKDIWGHLPETLRQEVDHYYRDQFMPRYRDLLQQYYSRLAERDRNRGRDR